MAGVTATFPSKRMKLAATEGAVALVARILTRSVVVDDTVATFAASATMAGLSKKVNTGRWALSRLRRGRRKWEAKLRLSLRQRRRGCKIFLKFCGGGLTAKQLGRRRLGSRSWKPSFGGEFGERSSATCVTVPRDEGNIREGIAWAHK